MSDCLASILLPGDSAISRSWGSLGVSVELHWGSTLEEIIGFQSVGWGWLSQNEESVSLC